MNFTICYIYFCRYFRRNTRILQWILYSVHTNSVTIETFHQVFCFPCKSIGSSWRTRRRIKHSSSVASCYVLAAKCARKRKPYYSVTAEHKSRIDISFSSQVQASLRDWRIEQTGTLVRQMDWQRLLHGELLSLTQLVLSQTTSV